MLLLGMLFLFSPSTTSAQQSRVLRTHSISTPTLQQTQVPTTGTLNVVAVMVQFQPDTNRLTSGTGIFGNDGMEGLPYLALRLPLGDVLCKRCTISTGERPKIKYGFFIGRTFCR